MNTVQRDTIVLLLVWMVPAAVWGWDSKTRTVIPEAVNAQGVILEFKGFFEAEGLQDQAVVVYRDPTDKSYSYLTVPSRIAGKDQLEAGGLAVKITVDDEGSVDAVVLWEGEEWSNVAPLDPATQATDQTPRQRPVPDWDQVPPRPPCNSGSYGGGRWVGHCLVDWFLCDGDTLWSPVAACCDGGGVNAPDCQEVYGVPLPTAQ